MDDEGSSSETKSDEGSSNKTRVNAPSEIESHEVSETKESSRETKPDEGITTKIIGNLPNEGESHVVSEITKTENKSEKDDSVRINIEECVETIGDADVQTDPETDSEGKIMKTMDVIINLEDDLSKVQREVIRPQRSILVYAVDPPAAVPPGASPAQSPAVASPGPAARTMDSSRNRHADPVMVKNVRPIGETLEYTPDRNDFVRKVFAIVFIMLMVTFIIVFFVMVMPAAQPIREVLRDRRMSRMFIYPSLFALITMNYVFFCSECSRVMPCNIVCLTITVFLECVLVCAIIICYRIEVIVIAIGVTAATVLFCLLLACSSFDFTRFLLYFVVIIFAFMALAFIVTLLTLLYGVLFTPLHLIILSISILLSMISLIMQLQMILGGRAVEIGEEDYALAAYMLYTSIVQLFLEILRVVGWLFDDN